jgi:hypothetical protein
MKSKKINLLLSRKNYQQIEKYFSYIKYVTFILMVVFSVFLVYIFYTLQDQNKKIKSLQNEKKRYLELSKNSIINEANIAYIQKKYNIMNEFAKNDVKSLEYFSLLIRALSQKSSTSSESSQLASSSALIEPLLAQQQIAEEGKITGFKLDQNRNVEFKISFNNFQRVMDFLTFIEGDDFLKYFQQLSFNQFDLKSLRKQNNIENYELSFKGIFNKLNENSN